MSLPNQEHPDGLFRIIITAIIALLILSLIPWDKWTGHRLKDFNLFSDLMPETDKTYITNEIVDPEFEALITPEPKAPAPAADSVPQDSDTTIEFISRTSDFEPPTRDGVVLIEDYSPENSNLAAIAAGLNSADTELYRIAFVGDSYIEGDIFTQNIRAQLQDTYGGTGVGYLPAYSAIPGFRQSVSQSGTGWNEHEIRKISDDDMRLLQGTYFSGDNGACANFKGTKRPAHTDSWSNSQILFIAPSDGAITLSADDGNSQTYPVNASDDIQQLSVAQPTTSFSVTSTVPGLKVAGIWLDGSSGVSLDCMSLRGNSGLSHRKLSGKYTSQLRKYIDYNLIVLEFGINALTSAQTNYTTYANAMVQVVRTIKSLYPDSKILILGIGDRGQKQGTVFRSMPTAVAMVNAQREVARRTQSMFWDTRQAMGGDGAVIDWHNRKLINNDYIHLNHKGGAELADIFVKSLKLSLSE